jgi:DNA-binding transcriptional ArsR family regulator
LRRVASSDSDGARALRVQPSVNYAFLEPVLEALANPVRLRLLGYLTQPHYLEEIAVHLGITRQAARKHLDKLEGAALVERRSAMRDQVRVLEFVINPQTLFLVHDEAGRLGELQREDPPVDVQRTRHDPAPRSPAMPASGPCLYTMRGLQPGRRHALGLGGERRWTIGRDEGCDVVVGHDPYASNRHALIRYDRTFFLQDLGSANGTLHNWAALPRDGEVMLAHGDVLGVGKTLLLFWEAPRQRVWMEAPGQRPGQREA